MNDINPTNRMEEWGTTVFGFDLGDGWVMVEVVQPCCTWTPKGIDKLTEVDKLTEFGSPKPGQVLTPSQSRMLARTQAPSFRVGDIVESKGADGKCWPVILRMENGDGTFAGDVLD